MAKAIAIKGKGEAKTTPKKTCIHIDPKNINLTEGCTNSAKLSEAVDVSVTVFANGYAIILKKSIINESTGCKDGWIGQQQPPKPANGPCTMNESSLTVLIEGYGVVRKGDKTQNDFNNSTGEITEGSDNVFAGD